MLALFGGNRTLSAPGSEFPGSIPVCLRLQSTQRPARSWIRKLLPDSDVAAGSASCGPAISVLCRSHSPVTHGFRRPTAFTQLVGSISCATLAAAWERPWSPGYSRGGRNSTNWCCHATTNYDLMFQNQVAAVAQPLMHSGTSAADAQIQAYGMIYQSMQTQARRSPILTCIRCSPWRGHYVFACLHHP